MPNKQPVLAIALCFAWMCSSAFQSSLAAPPTKDSEPEWMLKQSSDQYGHFILYLSKNAAKITNQKSGYEILTKAPAWKVVCFRRDDMIQFTAPLSEFTGLILHNPFASSNTSASPLSSSSQAKFQGVPCVVYRYGPNKCTIADDSMGVAPEVAEFLCRFYYAPVIAKVPLQMTIFRSKESREHFDRLVHAQAVKNKSLPFFNMPEISNFVTAHSGTETRISTQERKEIPYSASDFECPAGMKSTSDTQQLMFSKRQKDDLRDLVNEIGFSSDHDQHDEKKGKGKN